MELRHLFEILLRRKWIVINVFLAIFLTILIGTLLIRPWYTATSKVFLQKSTAASTLLSSLGLQGANSAPTSYTDTDRSDYLALAKVSAVADKVIQKEHVTRERTRAIIMRRLPFLKPILRAFGVNTTDTTKAMKAEDLTRRSLLSFIFPRPYVNISQYETSDIIVFEAIDTDPEKASKIANAMARVFVENEVARIRGDFKGAKEFIDNKIKDYDHEYKKALEALREFKEREKTVSIDLETSDLIQKISDLRKSREDVGLNIQKIKASTSNIETQLKKMPKYYKDSEQLKSNNVIDGLKASLNNLYISLAETKTKYTAKHPAVIDIENKIDEAKKLIKEEAEKVFGTENTSFNPLYRDLTSRVATNISDLTGYEAMDNAYSIVLKKYQDEMMQLPKKSYEFAQLSLAASVTQDIYNSLLKYTYQVGIAEAIAVANIYIVENAKTPDIDDPKHKWPRIGLNGTIALFLGTILGICAALLVEYLDDTIKTVDDLKALKAPTFLGSIPRLRKKDVRLIDELDPKSPLREAFRTVRNSIRFATVDKPAKTFLVTSSIQGEGKSFVAANIAISAIGEGKRVLILDGDMRKPGIHSCFGLDNSIGLTDYLVGDADLASIQKSTRVNGLSVITTGPIPPDPAGLVESGKMRLLLEEITSAYDFVIIDSPPILAATDALILGAWADSAIFIVESGNTIRKLFADAKESLEKANVNVAGVVLNKTSGRASFHHYHYYRT